MMKWLTGAKRKPSKIEKELRLELAHAKWDNFILRKKTKENNLLKRSFNHELRAPMIRLHNVLTILEENPHYSEEEREEMYKIGHKSVEQSLNMASLTAINGTSKEEMKKNYEKFSLEEIATNNAYIRHMDLEEEKIELDLKYNKIHQQEMKANSYKPAIEAIWKTIFENAGNFAPNYTKIKQGMRFNEKGDFELIVENKHDQGRVQRNFGGLGEAIGLKLVKTVLKPLNGKLEKYDHPIMKKTYHRCDKYGHILNNEDTNNTHKYETFAIKITIPKSEISPKQEN